MAIALDDPLTIRQGHIIGGYTGGQHQPLQILHVQPNETVRIPVVGTASYQPRLNHAIPVGTWALIAPVDLGDRRRAASPPLDFDVID